VLFAAIAAVQANSYDFSEATALLESARANLNNHVAVIVRQNGVEVYAHHFSEGDINYDTKVRMASFTKTISAGVVLALWDEGHLSLDERLGDTLSSFSIPGIGEPTVLDAWAMLHGIECEDDLGRPIECHRDSDLTMIESLACIAQNGELMFEPGTHLGYDGVAMHAVGGIGSIRLGYQPWEQIARTRVFDKCQMPTTDYDQFYPNPAVAGGLRTSANEAMNYAQMILDRGWYNGQKVLSDAAIELMFTNHTRGFPVYHTIWPETHPLYPYGVDPDYAFGAWVLAENPATQHVEEIMGAGAWGSYIWIDRRRGLTGVLITDINPTTKSSMDAAFGLFDVARRQMDAAQARSLAAVRLGAVTHLTWSPASGAVGTRLYGSATAIRNVFDLREATYLGQYNGASGVVAPFEYYAVTAVLDALENTALTPGHNTLTSPTPQPDIDDDGDIDGDDLTIFETCASGPAVPLETCCEQVDMDGDHDGDQSDFGVLQVNLNRSADRWVFPQETDPAIDNWLSPHFVALDPGVTSRNRLFVFFGGSTSVPEMYTEIVRFAAEQGYHAVGVAYPNEPSVTWEICSFTSDPDCHGKVREEVFEGVDASLMLNPANSIRNRLVRLLEYLDAHYPAENWGRFLDAGEPAWASIAMAGHSEGAGYAAFAASRYRVWRVVLFAGGFDIFLGQEGAYAPWVYDHVTPTGRYWAFVHEQDNPQAYLGAWEVLGLPEFGPVLNVEETPPPYQMSRQLRTSLPSTDPDGPNAFHGMVIVDDHLPRDADGRPTYLPVWRYLLTTPSTGDAFRMNPPGLSYIDPELLSEADLVTFQDQFQRVWLAELDPVTGAFVVPDGQDVLIDTQASPPAQTNNGPEFGLDADAWAIFYNKPVNTVPQTWRATVAGGSVVKEPLTIGKPHLSALASKNAFAPTTRLFALRGTWETGGTIAWFDESTPQIEYDVEFVVGRSSSAHWITHSDDFVFAWRSGPDLGQMAYYDTETNTIATLTNDAGVKSDPWAWFAPEYCGELLLLAVIDEAVIGVYRNLGDAYWTRIATLTIPAESQYTIIGSPEPFIVDGRSYMTLTIKGDTQPGQPFAAAEIWIFGINDAPSERFARRCDDGEPGAARLDPEWFIGREQVFVYYNKATATDIAIWGCPAGIPVGRSRGPAVRWVP
jgi:CubicO group peptidase (beta-lactamase class C family)